VAYKLAWRLATLACGGERVTPPLRELLLQLLALAAMGVVADVVPLVGENRVIARHGLARVKHSSIEGLRALVAASGLDGERIDAADVGFKLGPRLNACGRLGHARDAVELLTTATGDRAQTIARDLSRLNDQRRRTERAIFEQACELAHAAGMTAPDRRAIVLAHPDWHPGVVGIVCSRLVEKFHRPAILLRDHAGECHGSGRSVDGFNLHAAIGASAPLLSKFGGHEMAAGLTLPSQHLPAFADAFTRAANHAIPPDRLVGLAHFDCDAALAELSPRAVAQLASLGPFGRANPEVRLRVSRLRLLGRAETFGTNNAHLAMRVTADGARPCRLVAWNWGPHAASIPPQTALDALITPRLSTWTGEPRPEPEVVDIRLT
jgi:single-stranded-DNA-specific exonuclease